MTGQTTIRERQNTDVRERQDLLTLQKRHNELYSAFVQKEPRSTSAEYRDEVMRLLRDMEKRSSELGCLDDYLHLRAVVDQWRKAGPALGIDVTNIILTPPPAEKLETTLAAEQPVWTDTSLTDMLRNRAKELSRYRAVRWSEQVSLDYLVELHRKTISPEEGARNEKEDWCQAQLYWTLAVLKGEFDLVRSLTPASYYRLEGEDGQMWLSEMTKLMAYLNWEARGCGWGIEEATHDYANASRELLNQVLNPQRKAAQCAFEPIQKYIEKSFLTDAGKLDATKGRTKRWIEVKSQRLLETKGAKKLSAEDQMRKFYENVTKAVLGVDEESTRLVVQALGLYSGFERYEQLVNCFEMAIAIYFLDAELVGRVLQESSAIKAA